MSSDDFDRLVSEANELGRATRHQYIAGTPELFGSAAFFASATDTLLESTRLRRELGGACYFVEKDGVIVLVGLAQESRGAHREVAIDPRWGSILWHTHPGMSFSIAAFSQQDIDGAREIDRPLLVIGYKSASPDVIGLTQAAGLAGEVAGEVAGGLGGDAVGEKAGEQAERFNERLLRMGVGARVCWPNGVVRPVRRYRREGAREMLDEATFQVDRVLGAGSRVLEPASRRAVEALEPASKKAFGLFKKTLGSASRRARDFLKK